MRGDRVLRRFFHPVACAGDVFFDALGNNRTRISYCFRANKLPSGARYPGSSRRCASASDSD